eukprot:2839927-Amphidinium_carterae.1
MSGTPEKNRGGIPQAGLLATGPIDTAAQGTWYACSILLAFAQTATGGCGFCAVKAVLAAEGDELRGCTRGAHLKILCYTGCLLCCYIAYFIATSLLADFSVIESAPLVASLPACNYTCSARLALYSCAQQSVQKGMHWAV